MSFQAAAIQLNSGPTMAENLHAAEKLVREAAAAGAQLVALPENTGFIAATPDERRAKSLAENDLPALPQFTALAKELDIWLLSGSFAVQLAETRLANRCYLIGPGGMKARYDKIHMFDVDLPNGEKYRESDVYSPGDAAPVVATPLGKMGLTICYDLRFPQLFRALAQKGAEIIFVPSAFTVPTGQAHWHTLLRARAIETGAYIIAPAQAGEHAGGRKTFGHSLIINPWGEIIAEKAEGTGLTLAEIDLSQVAKARANIPAWRHEAKFKIEEIG